MLNLEILVKIWIKFLQVVRFNSGTNQNYRDQSFRFYVDSPLTYNQIYEYNIENKKLKLL